MHAPRLPLRSVFAAGLLLGALPASAQLNVIYALDFDAPATPWAATGSVTIGGSLGAPALQNTDLAPGAGNAYSAVFDGTQFQFGGNFAGLDPETTGYGLQLWVKNPGSTFPSDFWQNIASFGFSADSGQPEIENGVALGLYEGQFWGVSNRGLTGIVSTQSPGAGPGSINGWDHLAFVADGSVGSFYLNGALVGTRSNFTFAAPSASWHLFAGLDGYPAFTGLADSLKLFTFTSGDFAPAQLDYALAIPEPSSYAAFLGCAAAGLALCRRSRRA